MNITIFPQPSSDNNTGGGSAEYTIGQIGIFNPNNVADGFSEPGATLPLNDYPQLENKGYQTVSQGDILNTNFGSFSGNIGLKSFSKTKQFTVDNKNYIISTKQRDVNPFSYYIEIGEYDSTMGYVTRDSIDVSGDLSNQNMYLQSAIKSNTEILIGYSVNGQVKYFFFDSTTNQINQTIYTINNSTATANINGNNKPYIIYNNTTGKWLLISIYFGTTTFNTHLFSTTTITDDTSFIKECESPNNESHYYNEIINDNFYYNGSYYFYAFDENKTTYSILKIDENNLTQMTVFKDILSDPNIFVSKGYLDSNSSFHESTNLQIDQQTGKFFLCLISETYSPESIFYEYDFNLDQFEEKLVKKTTYNTLTIDYYVIFRTPSGLYHFLSNYKDFPDTINTFLGDSLPENKDPYIVDNFIFNLFNGVKDSINYSPVRDSFYFSGFDFSTFGQSEQVLDINFSFYDLPYDSVVLPEIFIQGLDFNFARNYIYIGQPSTVS